MKSYRKLVAAAVGAALQAVQLGLLDGDAALWIGVVIAALTAAGVYRVSNAPAEA